LSIIICFFFLRKNVCFFTIYWSFFVPLRRYRRTEYRLGVIRCFYMKKYLHLVFEGRESLAQSSFLPNFALNWVPGVRNIDHFLFSSVVFHLNNRQIFSGGLVVCWFYCCLFVERGVSFAEHFVEIECGEVGGRDIVAFPGCLWLNFFIYFIELESSRWFFLFSLVDVEIVEVFCVLEMH
jgi:hypothetical protein